MGLTLFFSHAQLSVVAHCEDVATMMVAAVGCDAAGGQIFNAVTTKAVTLNGMVEICAKAAGVEVRPCAFPKSQDNCLPILVPEGTITSDCLPIQD
jgi:nucleoside-diphosphate-sugar epimerase